MKKLISLFLASILSSLPLMLNAQTLETNSEISEPLTAVFINQADESALKSLKGVGTAKALAIIAFRDEYGKFESLDDLLKVKGIGKKILLENAKRIKI